MREVVDGDAALGIWCSNLVMCTDLWTNGVWHLVVNQAYPKRFQKGEVAEAVTRCLSNGARR